MLNSWVAVLALAAACLPAQAGVVYKWKTDPGYDFNLRGIFEVTRQAYKAGSLTYLYDPVVESADGDPTDPDAPLLALGLVSKTGGFINRYRDGATGSEDDQETFVDVTFGPLLRGELFAGGNDHVLGMSSDQQGLWTINYFTAIDSQPDCGEIELCSGVTGRWVLYSVPTPESLSLVGLSLIGLIVARRATRVRDSGRHQLRG